jgi:ketosteroid isomerase-like protein
MQISKQPITGAESTKGSSPAIDALTGFYRAFNHQDLELMAANWLQSEEVSMSNPLGGIKRGWDEIKEVYENIFYGSASVYVEFYDYSIHESGSCFFVVGRERGFLNVNNEKVELAIRTTRIYVLHDGSWRQAHHHGSMDNAELLDQYQRTILTK